MKLVIEAAHLPLKGFINMNAERGHSRYLGALHAKWRRIGYLMALGRTPVETPVVITARFRFPTNQLRDTSNLFPTIKHLVDGIVEAGVMKADDDRHVTKTVLERERPNGPVRLTLEISPAKEQR